MEGRRMQLTKRILPKKKKNLYYYFVQNKNKIEERRCKGKAWDEMLSRVQFCTVFIHVSTSQQFNTLVYWIQAIPKMQMLCNDL